jgi:hypothetical protein
MIGSVPGHGHVVFLDLFINNAIKNISRTKMHVNVPLNIYCSAAYVSGLLRLESTFVFFPFLMLNIIASHLKASYIFAADIPSHDARFRKWNPE